MAALTPKVTIAASERLIRPSGVPPHVRILESVQATVGRVGSILEAISQVVPETLAQSQLHP